MPSLSKKKKSKIVEWRGGCSNRNPRVYLVPEIAFKVRPVHFITHSYMGKMYIRAHVVEIYMYSLFISAFEDLLSSSVPIIDFWLINFNF